MLKKNIVNPKYRKLLWALIIAVSAALWVPTLMKMNANINGVSFTHFDQELAISCVLDESSLGVSWECKSNQNLDFDKYNPEAKNWVYDTDDGEVVVSRTINFGEVRLEVDHPKLRRNYTALVKSER